MPSLSPPAAQEEPVAQDAQDDAAESEGVSFHDAEVAAQVEAPVATSESPRHGPGYHPGAPWGLIFQAVHSQR